MDPNIFYPRGGGGGRRANGQPRADQNAQEEEVVKAFCRHCPVQTDCMEYAISIKEFNGVWGSTELQRRRIVHQRKLRKSEAS